MQSFKNGLTESLLEVRSKHKPSIIFLNPVLLLSLLIFLIFLTEASIMLVMAFLQPLNTITEALIDAFALSVILFPILYLFVFRPTRLYLTERKKAEDSLKESERRFRETLENANLIAVQLDNEGIITFANKFLLILTGWDMMDILGKNWMDIFIPDEIRNELKQFHRKNVTEGKIKIHYENEIITRKGEKCLISWNNSHLYDLDGNIIGITAIGEDITARKRVEEAYQESEERFKLMMHQSPSVIELYDGDGLQVDVNRAYEVLWNFPASHTVNKFNVLKSKEVEDTDLMKYVKEAYAGNTVKVPPYKFDPTGATEAKGKGRIRWLSTLIYPLKDKSGNVKNVVITHEDISEIKFAEEERKKLEQELLDIEERERQRIGYDLHDGLGQLLTGVSFKFASLVGKLKESLKSEAEDIADISGIINDAKTHVAQLSRGLLPLELESEGIESAIEKLASYAEKTRGISSTFTSSESFTINNEKATLHLYRIAQEAVNNAVKHSNAKHIEINLEKKG